MDDPINERALQTVKHLFFGAGFDYGAARMAMKLMGRLGASKQDTYTPDLWMAEGYVCGRAEALARLMEVRGVEVSPEARHRIAWAIDDRQSELWEDLALTVETVDELFV